MKRGALRFFVFGFLALIAAINLLATPGIEKETIVKIAASTDVAAWDTIWRQKKNDPQHGQLLPPSLPGPADLWAGGEGRSVVLPIKAPPGGYELWLDFYDSHESAPPTIRVEVDGKKVAAATLPAGRGAPPPYDAINPALAIKVAKVTITDTSQVAIISRSGSWAAPAKLRLLGGATFNPYRAGFALLTEKGRFVGILLLLFSSVFFFQAARKGKKEGGLVTLLLAFSVLFTFVMAEGFFRLYTASQSRAAHHKAPDDVKEEGGKSAKNTRLPAFALPNLVRPTTDPDIPYRLRPSIKGRFGHHQIVTNSFGMRGAEIDKVKPPGVIRLGGLGDSTLFGWGVAYEKSTLPILAGLLEEKTGRKVEIANLAAPGYNTAVEVATYRKLLRPFSPDVVVMMVIANDFGYPTIMVAPDDLWAPDRSYLAERLVAYCRLNWPAAPDPARKVFTNRDISGKDKEAKGAKESGEATGDKGLMEARVRDYYAKTLGFERALGYIGELGEMVKADGATGVVIYHANGMVAGEKKTYDPHAPQVAKAAERAGMIGIDMTPIYIGYLARQPTGAMKDHLWAGVRDAHPNETAHQMMATEIVRRLDEAGWPQQGR